MSPEHILLLVGDMYWFASQVDKLHVGQTLHVSWSADVLYLENNGRGV